MKETNFTSHPLSRIQMITRTFLVFAICCFGITSAQADHLPVGDQPATPYIVPDNIIQVDQNGDPTNVPILFEDTKTAILELVGMNCGTMTYPFFDAGGLGAPFSDENADQAFTICLRNPMLQSFSVNFTNITFDPNSGESLNIYDGDDINDPLIGNFTAGPVVVAPGDSGADDGSTCLTFELTGLQGVSSSEGFRAEVRLFEFAPSVTCLPFVEVDGFVLGGPDGLTPAMPPVSVGIANNGLVEINDCNDTIPQQTISVDWGCGLVDNVRYSYDVKVTSNGGTPVIFTGGPATTDPQDITVPGAGLAVGSNQVMIVLNYTDANTGVTQKASCTTDIVVNTSSPLVCNDDLNIGLDADCAVEISPDDLLENPCTGTGVSAYVISVELVELNENYCIDQNGDLVFNNLDVQLLLASPGVTGNGTNSVTVTIPGYYRYFIQLGDQSCWGFFHLEDKRGPVCAPAGDDEWNSAWDVDCDGIVETRVQANDPSGVDDLLDEYVLCKFIEINEGPELWFDILEPRNADLDGNGTTDVIGDFVDCSGIDYIYFQDEQFDICDLSDLNDLPVDETRYDVTQFEICEVYQRTWFAIDKGGYQSAQGCSQYVFSLRPKAQKIELPLEMVFTCEQGESQAGPTFTVDGGLENGGAGSDHNGQFNFIAPFTNNAEFDTDLDDKVWVLEPNTHSCKYAVSFHADPQIDICATSYKKLYHWSVIDWCDGSRIYDEFTQLVKVEDTVAPVIELANGNPADGTTFTVNVSYFECTSDANILALLTDDNCDPDVSQIDNVTIQRIASGPHDGDIFVHRFPNGGNLLNDLPANAGDIEFPIGDYTVTYFATDDCGNQSIATLTMQVRDNRAPVAICNDALNVTLTNFDGILQARIHPEDVDDTSYDNCQVIGMKVRSNDNAFTGDNNWGDFVQFSCDDVAPGNEDVKVELLVFEDRNNDGNFVDVLTPNPAYTPGSGLPQFFNSSDGIDDVDGGLSSTCWAFVNVEDKDIPAIVCEDKVLDCDDPNLEAYRSATPTEAGGLYICPPTFAGGCPNSDDITLTMFPFDITYDATCRQGTFVRRWTARRTIDGVTRTATCDQYITVNFKSDWTMNFPLDQVYECADDVTTLPAPLAVDEIIDNDGCDQWGMEVTDETFDIIGQDGDGACYKVVRTYKFINWCTWDPTNTELAIVNRPEGLLTSNPVQLRHRSFNFGRNDFGDEEDGDIYNEIISALDITAAFFPPAPIPTNTPDDDGAMVLIDNDFNLGDDPQQGDVFLFYRQYNERINNNDNVGGVYANNYGYFAYRQIIKVADTQAPVIAPIADITLCDTVAVAPNCGAPITICGPVVEECRPSYLTSYTVVNAVGTTIASGNFPQGATPEDCVDLGIQPFGVYTVTYLVEDGCGNFSDVTYTIKSSDCKAPTAYCIFGLSVDLMPSGMVELWASDFDAGSFDECSEPVTVSFDAAGTQNITFDCDNVGSNQVQLWATDAAGNQAFCSTFVVVQPNPNIDGSSGNECVIGSRISGEVQTEAGDDVEAVEVTLSGNMDATFTTGVDGTFEFTNVELGHDYTVTAEKDVNHLNGVSTFDLVLIKKHIIGSQLLDSPYKMIAADVNNSGSITTFDMVSLRKLILNIDTEFSGNTSWRFVDGSYQFPNPSNPWAEVFPELANINDIAADQIVNFVAVKVGDVNGSAIPNNFVTPDDRSNNATFAFNVADQAVKAGETYTVDFTADMAGIAGYQFTLNYNNLDLVEVVEGVATANNFGIFAEEGVITTSWEGEATKDDVLFSLVFTAQTDANLSELMNISSRYTVAEAYQGTEVMNVSLDFGNGIVDAANELYQNTPNPFQGATTVAFNLAQAGSATITVSDVTGKVIKLVRGDFAQGMNTVQFDSKSLNATGVLYYTLKTADFTATRKMVIIK